MGFPEVNAIQRTETSLREQHQPEHHTGTSPFEELEDKDTVSGWDAPVPPRGPSWMPQSRLR